MFPNGIFQCKLLIGHNQLKICHYVADGIEKYRKNFEQISQDKLPMRISLDDASNPASCK